jgi:hypothetical protein
MWPSTPAGRQHLALRRALRSTAAVGGVGSQAVRTGAAVAAGTRVGVLGLEALAVAAVSAGAAILAVRASKESDTQSWSII